MVIEWMVKQLEGANPVKIYKRGMHGYGARPLKCDKWVKENKEVAAKKTH
ncbi:MAG TPA: hypothetical protein VM577_09315 [Anaerovoracaceae bacterium]|nr:hypothetical protein [Anaerovoracaceae bacterium]